MPKRVFVFNHIGKTAGSTMRQILWHVFDGSRVFMATVIGTHVERMAELRTRLTAPKPDVDAIIAHTGYGVHERLPDGFDYRLYTMLRDPVERTLSQYYFEIQKERLSASVSLLEFLERDLHRAYNVQAGFLGGLHVQEHLDGLELRRDLFDEDLLERAKANLRTHDAIGLTERFDESLLLMGQAFGWPLTQLLYVRKNAGTLRPKRPVLTDEEREAVREHNRLDLALYAYAQELFDEQLRTQVPDAEARLDRFQRLNRMYGRWYPVAHPPVRALARVQRGVRALAERG
jgi:hypothetical protein